MRAEPFDAAELSQDAMLGGKVQLLQPIDGYRAGTDPVLLAAAVSARPGQSVLELGCGAGPGLCCLGVRVPGLTLCGLELQPGYADLARRNLALNGLEAQILEGDLADPPKALKAQSFDHVFANPPYFEKGRGLSTDNPGRTIARAGDTPLEAWVACATKRLRPRGYATFIIRAERLPDLISAMQGRLGALELMPLWPRAGRPPRLILLRGRKEGRAPFRFHPGIVIHEGEQHREPGRQYTDLMENIMQNGASLDFPPTERA